MNAPLASLLLCLGGCGTWVVSWPGDTAPPDPGPWYRDGDGDGFGDDATAWYGTTPPAGFVEDTGDCDDDRAAVHPGAEEACDGLDNDCDGSIDEDPPDPAQYYADADGDGFGAPTAMGSGCAPPPGATFEGGDCDDGDPAVHPEATEICGDGIDNDCDGSGCPFPEGTAPLDEVGFRLVGVEGYARAGASVALTGDVDGDGWDDVLLGGPGSDVSTGAAWLVGGPFTADQSLALATAHLGGVNAMDEAGFSVAGPGDTDGDGFADVLVGAPGNDTAGTDHGLAWLLRGPISGALSLAAADATILTADENVQDGGASMHGLQDRNGDGLGDFSFGYAVRTFFGFPEIFIVDGPVSGTYSLTAGPVTSIRGDDGLYGGTVQSADLDGDGIIDLAVSGRGTTAAWMLVGPVTGIVDVADAEATFTDTTTSGVTRSIAPGDVDGDGREDLAVGSPEDGVRSHAGVLAVLTGPFVGTRAVSSADLLILGDDTDQHLGEATLLQDVDGDAIDDVVVGAPQAGDAGAWSGVVAVARAPASGVVSLSAMDVRLHGPAAGDEVGRVLDGGRDLNRDGVPDLVVAAPGDGEGGVCAGAAWILFGGAGW